MKKQKLVCVIIAIVLLCSTFLLPASAQEQQPDEAALLQAFKGYLDAQGIKYMDPSMPEVETVVADFLTYSGGWVVFLGFYGPIMPMPTSDRIGNYVFYSDNWYEPYQIGLFAEKDGVVLTLKEAYEAGEIDIDAIAQTDSPYINARLSDEAALLQAFKAYLDENKVEYKDWEELVSVEPITQSNGWTVFFGHPGFEMPMPTSDRIGKYVFYSNNWYEPYQIGLFAEKDGTVLTLKEAYETGEIDIDSIASYTQTYLPGDTNMDGEITVEDVLTVQKVAAKRIDMEPYYASFNLCDYTGDQVINVQDVLAMQKCVAKVA